MSRDIYYFNPTCELAVANGSEHYMAPEKLRVFEDELSYLPAFLAQPDDIVLVKKQVSYDFQKQLNDVGFRLPESMTKEELFALSEDMHLGRIFPWGWSPAAHNYLSCFKPYCDGVFKSSPVFNWKPDHRELYSRKEGLHIFNSVIQLSGENWILSTDDIPVVCTEHEEIIELQKKWSQIVVKAPWSSSGRGLQILRPNQYNRTNRQIISGILRQQGMVTVGPWHEKILDLSFQFFSNGDGQVFYQGMSCFSTDDFGRYLGNNIEELPEYIDPVVHEFVEGKKEIIKDYLLCALMESRYATDYYGWLGVDAIIFKNESGNLIFHPCIEINCRFTMGAVALKMREYIDHRASGKFIVYLGERGLFKDFCAEMSKNSPLHMLNGKIDRGFLALTPVDGEARFGAYLSVNK